MSALLPLVWRPLLDQEHFQVSYSNEEAFQWVQKWPWPWNALCFYGPAGCGKTHLGMIWMKKLHQQGYPVQVWDAHTSLEVVHSSAYLVDNIQSFFHYPEPHILAFLNDLWVRKAYCLILSRRAPSQWPFQLNDLLSRVRSMMAVAISAPDDILLQKVLTKSLAEKGFRPSAFVLKFICTRMPRSFEAIREITTEMVKAQEKNPLTFQHLKTLLTDLYGEACL